jgi:hypothetical protein
VLLSDASRVLGLEPLAAFAVEWEDEDEEATTVRPVTRPGRSRPSLE